MARVVFYTSNKVRGGYSEVRMRFYHSAYDEDIATGIFVPVERWNAKEQRIVIPRFADTQAKECIESQAKLDKLKAQAYDTFNSMRTIPQKGWLKELAFGKKETQLTTIAELCDQYTLYNNVSQGVQKHYKGLKVLLTKFAEQKHEIYINNVSVEDIYEFELFLRDGTRCQNTINMKLKKLRAIIRWAYELGKTKQQPFEKFKISEDVYGTPIYLTLEERDHFANFEFSKDYLNKVRDIFTLQAHIGCRVSDLKMMNKENITDDGFLEYIQQKKVRVAPIVVRVPLTAKAKELIEKYDGHAHILPEFNTSKYCNALKVALKEAGIDRLVQVLDNKTLQTITKPIYETASSHLARRTFIANLYKATKSERLVTSLTGHSINSKSLSRYTNVDDDMKLEMRKILEQKKDTTK